ncbi:MAG: DNA translocase FtsK 4TM domain-containing protein [Acidobacteriota bacterium]
MAVQKPRAKAKKQPETKPLFQLDSARWEEIAAIAVLILAAFTALGAFNLSGGFLLTTWVQLLQTVLGWGVFFAPILLLGLGIWLFLDALDRTVNIGWERPIGLGLGYLVILAVMHWVSAFANPIHMPGPFQGGGLVGWAITSILVQAFGSIGAAFTLLALISVALILLFNISLPELVRRVGYVARLVSNLPQEVGQVGKKRPVPPAVNLTPTRAPAHSRPPMSVPPAHPSPTSPAESRQGKADTGQEADASGLKSPLVARIIGSAATDTSRPIPATPVIQREWRLPNIDEILEESAEQEVSQQEIRTKVRVIEETLVHFGVPAKVLEVNQGPTITQFGVEPGFIEQKGTDGKIHRVKVKVSRISALQHDLELALAAAPIRIEAPVPGRSVVGIEVPNAQVGMVSLRGIIQSESFDKLKSKLRIALGQDVAGQPICADLTTMPHLLIAGATGSGKSVCINSIVAAFLCTLTPADVSFIMVDPKRVELVNFSQIPHLKGDVVTNIDGAVAALQGAVEEMDRRFQLFAQKGARNIDIYNHMVTEKGGEKLPFLVVIVDELADLMMVAANQVEHSITRLAQMARATGIHLILATQRPSVDVVTGLIKANFPARISFAVTSQIDSRVVLDSPGAEKLLGRGDMLYMASDSSKLLRLQGCYVSDRELDKLVTYWRGLAPPAPPTTGGTGSAGQFTQVPLFEELSLAPNLSNATGTSPEDALLPQAIEVLKQNKRASVSLLQRKLRIGYSRAARLMELLEEKGLVGPDEGPTKGRSVREPGTRSASNSLREFHGEDDYSDWSEEDWNDLDKE